MMHDNHTDMMHDNHTMMDNTTTGGHHHHMQNTTDDGDDDHTGHEGHNMEPDTSTPFCIAQGHGGGHGGGHGSMISAGMIMYMDGFRFSLREGAPCLNLYFPGWTLDTREKFLIAMAGVVAMGVLTELISRLRFRVQRGLTAGSLCKRWIITGLHGFQALVGYVLMLATMTFSFEILACVILGLALGYAIFYDEDDTHVTTNPCCNFIQSEADERLVSQHQQQQQQQEMDNKANTSGDQENDRHTDSSGHEPQDADEIA